MIAEFLVQKKYEKAKDHLDEVEELEVDTTNIHARAADPNVPVTVLTDASRLQGLGHALGHDVDGRLKLVSCGSSVTPGMERELTSILDAIDSDYIKFRHDVMNGTESCSFSSQMKSVFGQLSVDDELGYLDAKRIVWPLKAVKEVMRLAHLPHAGITKTYELLRSLYFWPGMFNDVKQVISACGPCTKNAVSLPKNPRSTALPSVHFGPRWPALGWICLTSGAKLILFVLTDGVDTRFSPSSL